MRLISGQSGRWVFATAAVVTWTLASPAAASTRRHDKADQLYLNHAAQPQFASAGYTAYQGGRSASWVLIDPHWALTAAHVVDRDNYNGSVADEPLADYTFVLGSESRTPSVFYTSEYYDGNVNNGSDIALAYFSQPYLLTPPANLYTGNGELDKPVTTVGYGYTGTGKTGAFQDDNLKRAFDNRIDFYAFFPGTGEFNVSRIENTDRLGLFWDFDEPPPRISPDINPFNNVPPAPLRDLEGNVAPGDSGGPSFIFEDNQWWLVGISSAQRNHFNYPDATDPENIGTYGDGTLVTRVSPYAGWLNSIMDWFVPGDFSLNGTVDAADYVQWRKYNGQPRDYNMWRAHFGQFTGGGAVGASTPGSAAPEPTTFLMLFIGLLAIKVRGRRVA